MNQYDRQARNFLDKTKTKIEFRYLRTAPHFDDEKEARDVYEVRLTRGSRNYEFTFGNSVNATEERIRKVMGIPKGCEWVAKRIRNEGLKREIGIGEPWALFGPQKLRKQAEEMSEWREMTEETELRPYDVLSCLDARADEYRDVDEFAAEMGIEKPSRAIRTWEAVQRETAALKTLYSDLELESLTEIC